MALSFEIRFVDESWEKFERILELDYAVLYRDFGVPRDSDWYHSAEHDVHAVVLASGSRLLGAARLIGAPGDASRQLRQVAVEPAVRGMGLGAELVVALEDRAREEWAEEIWLNARDSAIGFYERLGYVAEGDEFVSELTGIPHRLMRRLVVAPHARFA